MDKKKWLEFWEQAIIDSGYYFVLDVAYIKRQLSDEEISDLSPEESAWIYIEVGKEAYNADKNDRNEESVVKTSSELLSSTCARNTIDISG